MRAIPNFFLIHVTAANLICDHLVEYLNIDLCLCSMHNLFSALV